MKISLDAVKHVAELARLEFKEDELLKFAEQLGNLLEYVGELNALDTTGVDPAFGILEAGTPLREDVEDPWLTTDEALENAPQREESFFAVPKVIE